MRHTCTRRRQEGCRILERLHEVARPTDFPGKVCIRAGKAWESQLCSLFAGRGVPRRMKGARIEDFDDVGDSENPVCALAPTRQISVRMRNVNNTALRMNRLRSCIH